MNIEEFRDFCLSLPGVCEKMPFTTVKDVNSREVLCFYVGSKWFCYINISVFDYCCVKCTPADNDELCAEYDGITPAWHMNKRHWIDVYFGKDVPDSKIKQLVKESYSMVFKKLTKRERDLITENHGG